MKKMYLLAILFLLSMGYLSAQIVIKGTVYDDKTKESVINASVYLEGTSYFTITDAEGQFELVVKKFINTSLVISHLSYDKQIIPNPFANLPTAIFMKEKENTIKEVVVNAKHKERFSRKQKLKAFREQFLGMTTAGKKCRILNEDDLVLMYDSNERALTVTCDVPIIIENRYLGYKITYDLVYFRAEYIGHTLSNLSMGNTLFMGPCSFEDNAKGVSVVKKRREESYAGSKKEFFKYFANQKLDESPFQVTSFLDRPFEEKYAYVDSPEFPSMKQIIIAPPPKEAKEERIGDYVLRGWLKVDYIPQKKKLVERAIAKSPQQGEMIRFSIDANKLQTITGSSTKIKSSIIRFATDTVLVDAYGNTNRVDKILLSGDMMGKRVGDMLPLDYEP